MMEKGRAPLGEPLRGCYTDSFAYNTLKDRIPVIVARIVNSLVVRRSQILSDPSVKPDDIKEVIERLSCLRYEITTNKPLKPLTDDYMDVQTWNTYLQNEINSDHASKWFHTTWMYAETYAYRRIFEAFQLTPSLKNFDYFLFFKTQQINTSIANMKAYSKVFSSSGEKTDTSTRSKELLEVFLKLSLWGNQCDLSISSGKINEDVLDIGSLVSDKEEFLLINDLPQVWAHLESPNSKSRQIIDIVLDNSGFELFTDLYLADFLVSKDFTNHVRFHVKSMPWFISDVTKDDFPVMLDLLRESLPELVARWESHLSDGKWSIETNGFWTYPHCFGQLGNVDKTLASELSSSKLVIFKGDLNYRKVVEDRNWEPTTSFCESLKGSLRSISLLCLRTLKADTVVGLSKSQAESAAEKDSEWMVNGKWGLISFNAKE